MRINIKKLKLPFVILFTVFVIIIASRHYDVASYLRFEFIQQFQESIASWAQQHLVIASVIYLVVVTIFSIVVTPGAMFIPVIGACFLGFWPVFLLSVPAVTFSFIVKYLFFYGFCEACDFAVKKKPSKKFARYSQKTLAGISKSFHKYKFYYFILLRLVPGFPSWLFSFIAVNAKMPLLNFVIWVFFGIMPAIGVYSYIGTSLGGMFNQGYQSWSQLLFQPQVYAPILIILIITFSASLVLVLSQKNKK